jgi:leucyl aminopeptidase (aminopeptidase T)
MKTKSQFDEELYRAAETAIQDVLKVKPGERVLIVTNPDEDVSEISQALYRAATAADARPTLLYQPVKSQLDFAEPEVIGAIKSAPDVIISMSANKIGKDEEAIAHPYIVEGKSIPNTFHYLMETKKTRSFWSPSVTREMFASMVPVDYDRMKSEAAWVKDIFDRAREIRVTAPAGTDVRFSVEGRKGMLDDGDFSRPGDGGNLPAGESFVSPVVGTTEGLIVYDGSISSHDGIIIIDEPIRVTYKNGFITEIAGGEEADRLKETIRLGEENAHTFEKEGKLAPGQGASYAKNARSLGELGIGLNPAAVITGNMLGDEKVYKTCHFAIGSNYDDDAEALIHLDGLVKDPTVVAVMKDGSEEYITRDGVLAL